MPINTVDIYSSSPAVQTFPLSDSGIEDDLFHILNIDGLDPVTASIGSSSLGAIDGVTITGTDVPARNLVITIHPNPDWVTWDYELLRRELNTYFTPKNTIRIVFHTDEVNDVEIFGVVESCEANPFSKEPQFIVSIICPDPYFTNTDPTVVTGTIVDIGSWPPDDTISVDGDAPIGFLLKLPYGVYNFGEIIVQSGDPANSTFDMISDLPDFANTNILEMNSIPKQKYVRAVDLFSGRLKNLFGIVQSGYTWPSLQPGENQFAVLSDVLSGQPWELTYFEKFGGL